MVLRFLIFSSLAALVNLSTGYILYGILGFDTALTYPASVATAFVAGMGVSFILNRKHTFGPSGRPAQEEICDFVIVSLGGIALTTGLAHGFLNLLKSAEPALGGAVPLEAMAHLMAVGLTAFYSFLAHKHFSFRRPRLTFTPGKG